MGFEQLHDPSINKLNFGVDVYRLKQIMFLPVAHDMTEEPSDSISYVNVCLRHLCQSANIVSNLKIASKNICVCSRVVVIDYMV